MNGETSHKYVQHASDFPHSSLNDTECTEELIACRPITVAFELQEQIAIFGALLHPELPTDDLQQLSAEQLRNYRLTASQL